MPNCRSCGEKVFTLDDELGRCLSCANANKPAIRPKTEGSHELSTRRRQAEQERQTKIESILLTTETAPNVEDAKEALYAAYKKQGFKRPKLAVE